MSPCTFWSSGNGRQILACQGLEAENDNVRFQAKAEAANYMIAPF